MSHIVRSDHIAITSGDKSTTGSKVLFASRRICPAAFLSRCVILATRSVATGRFGKVIRASHQLLSSVAASSLRTPIYLADFLQADRKTEQPRTPKRARRSAQRARSPPSAEPESSPPGSPSRSFDRQMAECVADSLFRYQPAMVL